VPYDTGYDFDIYVREEDKKSFFNAYVPVFEGLILLSFGFAKQFSLSTDALDNLGNAGNIFDQVRDLIYNSHPPGLLR